MKAITFAFTTSVLSLLPACGGNPSPAPTSIESEIVKLPKPLSNEWELHLNRLLTDRLDTDGSGAIDTDNEIGALSCEALSTLDSAVRGQTQSVGFVAVYGIRPDLIWAGGHLGIHESARQALYRRTLRCGLTELIPDRKMYPPAGTHWEALTGLSSPALGESWSGEVKTYLIGQFDINRSGSIDTPAERQAMGCETWAALDFATERSSTPVPLKVFLGCQPSLDWQGEALGLPLSERLATLAAIQGCGY